MATKSMVHDTLVGQEYWIRCPHCGDSDKDPHKAHYSINLNSGQYYCFRCNAGGVIEGSEWGDLFDLLTKLPHTPKKPVANKRSPMEEIYRNLKPGRGLARYSALDRMHLEVEEGKVDVFKSRTLTGELRGYHLRTSWKKIGLSFGDRAYGFAGPREFRAPWARIVEGPYDALDPSHDIVTFGFPSPAQIRGLRGLLLILCPDGDVWQDSRKTWAYFRPFLKYSPIQSSVIAVEYLPDGLDPDEVPVSERVRYSYSDVIRTLRERSSKWKAITPDQLKLPTRVDLDPFWMS